MPVLISTVVTGLKHTNKTLFQRAKTVCVTKRFGGIKSRHWGSMKKRLLLFFLLL